ncbi:hypothetical protein J437_LFUL006752 [Ladona fulva]|uniref:Uncharacterized protein n=1 Tax=Ladona fulva TaxID=123851 RepID=A0A8K0K1X2_LADFU|nr:hypothetical protein J437_LFUL006752 [Ladona fulva]
MVTYFFRFAESKKRRFHPLRELRRIFRIKSRRSPEDGDRDVIPQPSAVASSYGPSALARDEGRDSGGAAAAYGDLDEAYRSRSASELLSGEEDEEDEESPGGRRRGILQHSRTFCLEPSKTFRNILDSLCPFGTRFPAAPPTSHKKSIGMMPSFYIHVFEPNPAVPNRNLLHGLGMKGYHTI